MKILVAIQACHRLNELKLAQRETWMVDPPAGVDVRIFVGTFVALYSQARSESPYPQPDEVWLDVPDWKGYLSQKSLEIVRWAFNHDYDYIWKADVDTYCSLDRLLASGFECFDYVGHRGGMHQWRGRPVCYAQGGAGFWLSRRAMQAFITADQAAIPFRDAEDIRTGWLLEEHGILLHQDDRYEPYRGIARAPEPSNDVISTHKCTAEQIRSIHTALKEPHVICH